MKPIFYKDNLQRFFAYILLAIAFVVLIIGVGMTMDTVDKNARETGPSIIIISTIFFVPGILLLVFAKKNKKEEEIIRSLIGLLHSYKRMSLNKISEKLEISYIEAEKLISFAIEKKIIKGRFDRSTGEFYTDDAKNQKVEYKFCPNCGAPFDRVFLEGDTIKCFSCNTVF